MNPVKAWQEDGQAVWLDFLLLPAALYARFRLRRDHTFAEKFLFATRKGFGEHIEPKA